MSFTRLRYHIVTATHERRAIITPEIEPIIYDALRAKAEKLGGKIMYLGGIEDHVHMIAAIPPTLAVAKFIGDVKSAASGQINKQTREKLFQWQQGYGAFTVNPADMAEVIDYVCNQKARHARQNMIAIYERMEE